MTFARFITRHRTMGARLHWVLSLGGRRCGHGCPVCRSVWAELDTPEFRESMRRFREDNEAGRWYHYKDGETWPNEDWPKDGPQPTPGRQRLA